MRQREPIELASLLLKKAKQDEEIVAALLDNAQIADESLAFHAQQAAEKCLKAVLGSRKISYPRTHNLYALIDLVRGINSDVPTWLEDVAKLTPFAAAARYDDFPIEIGNFNRQEGSNTSRAAPPIRPR